MSENYRKELVQVAAACLAAAQVAEMDSTSLGTDNEGVQGRFALNRLIEEVREERRRQELKWGTRTGKTATPGFWLAVVGEEVGEVAEEVTGEVGGGLVAAARSLGIKCRAYLEML